ncbi:MAG: penicillin-binding protein 2 [Bacteroidota bacterium]|nr:penicillin-binding protein 2 [Candidatus Kapabacteria bacterium]MCS7301896.1 penicillin-binding protein 2 [Candidatus Kapabacteria bacterium]MCX7936149.1 penicillin-binding protein 2 [Chlorobiota bacterium]MDW8074957.1 penicillin-binding protein 2 [Bacteroidota bacterium]MDW8271596.1 penicillin-binding protein 2 [Bacteroidota bacterium]
MNTSLDTWTVRAGRMLRVAVLATIGLFVVRLGYLQVIRGAEYLQRSEMQAIKQRAKIPSRGCMYDRNGKMIVRNDPAFIVTMTPNDVDTMTFPLLARLVGKDVPTLRMLYAQALPYRFQQIPILRDAPLDVVAAIEEHAAELPGIEIRTDVKRRYLLSAHASHVFGYRAMVDERDIASKGDYYTLNDYIGKTGLEAAYEPFLRGRKGVQFVAVNAAGQPIERFNNGRSDIEAIEGADLYLSIDALLQEVAEQQMGNDHGAIVVLDPRNGEVLALVSKPDYDLHPMETPKAGEYFAQLARDSTKPLFNRAMQTIYPPGSTWKMLVALAALHEGILDEQTTIHCPGSFTYGGRSFKCHGAHGTVDVRRAIQVSCNVFFYRLGQRIGIDNLYKYGTLFGFGQLTGIDIAGERPGLLPSRKWFERRGVTGNLLDGRMINLGIGQGELGVTPLQMAVYVSAIANGGTLYQPHVVRAIYNKETGRLEKVAYGSIKLPLNPRYMRIVQEGMYAVCNVPGGTATNVRVEGVAVCGKTGTAQNPHGKDHSWFICYAPAENPTIAMCVMVENAGFGATRAAPIARAILDAYFHPERYRPTPSGSATASVGEGDSPQLQ